MATITEDYVSFEVAKLLKEKDFDEPCHAYYEENGTFRESYSAHDIRNITHPCSFGIASPTIQMAMKWLRIEYGIHIEPHVVKTKHKYGYLPHCIDLNTLKIRIPFDEFDFSDPDKQVCITYDKACNVCIKYTLENWI